MSEARTEHRAQMRRELVDAAIRTIEAEGPQASMRAIAAEAKISKPTLYEFFADKSDLAVAVADRAKQDIAQALAQARHRPSDTVGAALHGALAGYAALVVERPNIARFLFLGAENRGVKNLKNWHAIRTEVAELITLLVEPPGTAATIDTAFYASMIVGAVEGAADWWSTPADLAGTAAQFVSRTEPVVRAVLTAAAADAGVSIDFDRPLTTAS